jgi:membrane protein implicated in regulation of membrane protease activity
MSAILNWALVIAGMFLILLEVVLGAMSGFDFVLIGSAMVLGGVLGLIVHSAAVGAATAGVLALLYVAVGRGRIRNRLLRRNIPTNADALLGRTARVVETITPTRAGRIRLEGEEWRAQPAIADGPAIETGTTVRIERIDGVTVYVQSVPTGGSTP